MNRALFSVHCYLSWGFVAPYLMSGIHVAAALRLYVKGYSFGEAVLPSTGEPVFILQIPLSKQQKVDLPLRIQIHL